MAVLGVVDSLHMAGKVLYLICHQVVKHWPYLVPLSTLNVICYVPGPCRCESWQTRSRL